ncbi:TetR family transcriptional regulator C-terminal domain-containing protein [Brevibacterium daeguense]|uniref:TetR family transcriptional regulator C-terminal domain-containing protein n=1 Tax=Brevibacterium daeguense TaxID=909936 RepID=A0ABP8EHZ6_9MICO|nr:TetR/AcrR family transcriptional regulator [Brevibacterium daeguense]
MSAGTRDSIVRAMIEIIAAQGFEGLSVRGVAADAGVSAGAVQHHFPTREAMLGAAMSAITDLASTRGSDLEDIAEPVERLHALVDLLVPGSPSDRVARVWLAFAARAAVDGPTGSEYARLWSRIRVQLRLLIAAAGGNAGTVERASRELLALLDGLALSVVAERQEPGAAREIAHRRVDEIVGHQGQTGGRRTQ